MNENTTVQLRIGRLVIDAGTSLPPGGAAGLQEALASALARRLSQAPVGDVQRQDPPRATDGRPADALVDRLVAGIAASLEAHGHALGSSGPVAAPRRSDASPGIQP